MAPKPILNNTTSLDHLEELSGTETAEERHRRVAVFHAHRLQAQKDVENQVFEAIEAFLDFPLEKDSSSSEPCASDILRFQELIKLFQVSDYDALLDERRMAQKCGYVFCPNAPKKQDTQARYRILGLRKGQDFRIVETKSLEMWCSQQCARRALYVKVQLLEEPAWLRRGDVVPSVTLLVGDDVAVANKEYSRPMNDDQLRKAMEDLALERGDKRQNPRPEDLVRTDIVEKMLTESPRLPKSSNKDSIEGYEPRSTTAGAITLPSRSLAVNVGHAGDT